MAGSQKITEPAGLPKQEETGGERNLPGSQQFLGHLACGSAAKVETQNMAVGRLSSCLRAGRKVSLVCLLCNQFPLWTQEEESRGRGLDRPNAASSLAQLSTAPVALDKPSPL